MLRKTILLVVILLLAMPMTASAGAADPRVSGRVHPISITEATMAVTRTHAVTRIQMFAEDLVLFQGLEPDDQDRISPDDLRQAMEDHKQFLLEKFTIRNAAGERLEGQVTDLKPFEIPANGIPSGEMMMHTAVYEIEHTFSAPPEFLTIQQDISDENFIIPSEMSLHVHQAGTGLNYTERLLPGASTTLRFDWSQSLAEDATDAEWESWFEQQREATLGITSYSSVYSFIYIEPAEVRHEILIPLATLRTMIPVNHRDPAFVDLDEQEVIRESIRKWLTNENPVSINGTRVLPQMSRIDFYSLNLSDFATQAEPQRVSMASGRVGIIMTYATPDDSVRDVSMAWNLFYSGMVKIPVVVVAGPEAMDRFEYSKFNKAEDNILKWTCPPEQLPIPVEPVVVTEGEQPKIQIPMATASSSLIALVLCLLKRWKAAAILVLASTGLALREPIPILVSNPLASAELTEADATNAFESLHRSMYRSLDFGSEEKVYDVLATTVDGKLLEDLYLQLRKSLEIREQGGAVARIREVRIASAVRTPRSETSVSWPGIEMKATWTVAGTVEHWGHIHERQNQFEATFTMEPRDGYWKFTRMDIQGQQQKSSRTTLRRF